MNKQDETPEDEKGKPHGLWEMYHNNDQLYHKGYWVHGKEHGLWESYYDNGDLYYKEYYIR